jgi:hypothetical protein
LWVFGLKNIGIIRKCQAMHDNPVDKILRNILGKKVVFVLDENCFPFSIINFKLSVDQSQWAAIPLRARSSHESVIYIAINAFVRAFSA